MERNTLFVKGGESPRYFFIVTGEVSADFYFTPGSQRFVHYKAARKKPLGETFVMEAVKNLPRSFFIGLEYIQRAGSEWFSEHCIRDHSDLPPENQDLPDVTAFSYESHIALDQQVGDSSEQPRMKHGSRR